MVELTNEGPPQSFIGVCSPRSLMSLAVLRSFQATTAVANIFAGVCDASGLLRAGVWAAAGLWNADGESAEEEHVVFYKSSRNAGRFAIHSRKSTTPDERTAHFVCSMKLWLSTTSVSPEPTRVPPYRVSQPSTLL